MDKTGSGVLAAAFFFAAVVATYTVSFPSVTWLYRGGSPYYLPFFAAILLLASISRNRPVAKFAMPESCFLLALVALLVVNVLASHNALVSAVTNLELFALVALVFVLRHRDEFFFRCYSFGLFCTSLVIAYVSLVMYLSWLSGYEGVRFLGLPWHPSVRMSGLVRQPNMLATWLNIGLVLLVVCFSCSRSRVLPWLSAALLFCFCLRYTGSRAGLVTFALCQAFLVFVGVRKKDRWLCWSPVLLMLLLVLFFCSNLPELVRGGGGLKNVFSVTDGGDVGVFARLAMWGSAVSMFFGNMIFGVGGGGYPLENGPYLAAIVEKADFLYDDILYTWWAHNELFHYLSEYGLLFLVAMALLGVAVRRNLRSDRLEFLLVLMVISTASMFSWQLHSHVFRYTGAIALAGLLRVSGERETAELSTLPVSRPLVGTVIGTLITLGALLTIVTVGYNGYYDYKAATLYRTLRKEGLSADKINALEGIERSNPYIYNHLNKWFLESCLTPANSGYFPKLYRHGENFYRFENSFYSRYAYSYLRVFGTTDVLKDYEAIMPVINEGLALKPDYDKLWTLQHYLNMLRVSALTGKSMEELKPDENAFDVMFFKTNLKNSR